MTVEISPKSGPVGTPISRGQGHRLPVALQFLGRDLRQQLHRLDVVGDDARARRASRFPRPAAPATTSSKCCMANSRSRIAIPSRTPHRAVRASNCVHGHRRRAGAAAAAGAAGAKSGSRAAASGRTRGDAAVLGRRRAGQGARRRLCARQELQAQLDPGGRQPHDRPGLGRDFEAGRQAKADAAAAPNFASTRPTTSAAPTAYGSMTRQEEDRGVLDQADRFSARRQQRPGRHHLHDPSQGRRLDRDLEHLSRGL